MTNRNQPLDLQAELRRTAAAPAPPGREEFWREFRRRAPARLAVEPADALAAAGAAGWGWALRMAAVLALLATAAWWINRDPGAGAAPAVARAANGAGAGDVALVNVNVPCDGVMVVQDAADRGTVIWVAGLN
ncbi:MAG: hypothetical protein WC708_18535 [Lentisphaeria bacterium]